MDLGSTLRVLRPAENVLAFYDGRIPGLRAWSPEPNWLDDGAYELGVCTYALLDGEEALVYDTHISIPHAEIVRRTLADAGIRRTTVVLSHWHADHVAGNAVFADCEIVAHALTAEALAANRARLETQPPAIAPLVMPTRTYTGTDVLRLGTLAVELRHVDVHSLDGTVLWLADRGLLLAGDTLEDPVTYVAEPDRLEIHLRDLRRMETWPVHRILPNHGAEARIAAGGYGPELIGATRRYVEKLLACRADQTLAAQDLRSFAAADLAAGAIELFEPYEAVHRQNVRRAITGRR
jgi:cyclase